MSVWGEEEREDGGHTPTGQELCSGSRISRHCCQRISCCPLDCDLCELQTGDQCRYDISSHQLFSVRGYSVSVTDGGRCTVLTWCAGWEPC